MKIFDCFTFFNELEVLEIRLQELYNHVDYFVLVESCLTHSGNPKKLYYNDNKERFYNFNDKIIHIVVSDMPTTNNPWDREGFQRQCIWRGLKDISIGDIIMISDVDEIPNHESLNKKKEKGFDSYNVFEQKLYYMFLNTFSGIWNGTKSFIFDGNNNINLTKDIRYKDNVEDFEKKIIKNGGWHFSYLGDTERIQTKIKSFAHQELNTPNILNYERINKCRENHVDPVHGNKMQIVCIDNSYPEFIVNNIDKYRELIKR